MSLPGQVERPMELRDIYKVMKAEGMDPKRFVAVAKASSQIRKAFIEAGQKAVDAGLIENAIYKANLEHYLPHQFLTKGDDVGELLTREMKNRFSKIPFAQGLKLNRAIMRKDMPQEVYEELRLILEPAGPAALGYAEIMRDVEMARFYKGLGASAKEVSEKATLEHTVHVTSSSKTFGNLQIPKYGGLANKWITPGLEYELQGVPQAIASFERYMGKLLVPWKIGKVVFSPATHGRNIIGNAIMADMGGLPLYRVDIYASAMKDLLGKGKWSQEAGERLLGTTYASHDIYRQLGSVTGRNVLDWGSRAVGAAAGAGAGYMAVDEKAPFAAKLAAAGAGAAGGYWFGKNAKDLYIGEEQFFKLAKYIHNREKGMGVQDAIDDSLKWLFNYAEVPTGVRAMRSSTTPFITYSYKAVPRLLETAVTHPLRFGKYLIAIGALQQNALAKLDISERDWQNIQRKLPDYLKSSSSLLMPYRDEKGNIEFMDMTYMLPWGDLAEMGRLGVINKFIQNPAVLTLWDLGRNRNALDMPIYYDFNSPKVKAMKVFKHMAQMWMPSMTPGLGFNYQALHEAFNKTPGSPTKRQAYASTFAGLKLKGVNIREEGRKREYLEKMQEGEALGERTKAIRRGVPKKEATQEYRENIKRIYRKEK
jgi:hypothetical protein